MSYGQYSTMEKPDKPALPAKTKRIKTVFGARDTGVEHVWAHPQTKDGSGYAQDFATNPQRNFYFKTHEDGARVLYSYRDSYPIGSRFETGTRKRIVFLVRSGKPYSNTTAGHMSACRNAARNNGEVFYVPDVCGPYGSKPVATIHKANLADFAVRIQETLDEYRTARATYRIENTHLAAIALTKEAKRYAKVFGLKLPALPKIPKFDADRMNAARNREVVQDARNAAKREVRRQEEEKRAAERLIEHAETIAKWKNGEDVYLPYGLGAYAFLRVKGSNVETSQRVTVPISGPTGAARLLRFLQACKSAGRTYQTNGHSEHIGSFTVQSFKPARESSAWLLVAGCHRILWSEIESIAETVRKVDTENAEYTQRTLGAPVQE